MASVSLTPKMAAPSPPGMGGFQSLEKRTWLLGLLLVVAIVALYYPVGGYPFVNYDDSAYVIENINVQAELGWDTVQWAFTTLEGGNWHPVTWLSHALDCQLFHLNPAGHHNTNLLLHALNALLLFGVLRQATGFTGRAWMVAALFALHPVNVESVAWVSERKNLLSMLFFLLALGAYRWYAREPQVGRYALVALLFALGLMAKPQVITFPCVLLLWDYWPLRRMFATDDPLSFGNGPQGAGSAKSFRWLVVEKLPLFALSASSAVVTIKAEETGSGIVWYPLSFRVENAIVCYAHYVRNAFWPTRLAVLYPHPQVPPPAWQVAAAALFLLAVTALVAESWRRRYLAVGWLWFLGTLVPMIGLVQVGQQAMADRYAYLPFIGLFIMVCWSVADWAEHRHLSAALLPAASIAALLALTVVAHRQISYWSDSVTLWSHTLQVTTGNWVAERDLGTFELVKGNVDAAMPHFFRAVAINPSEPSSNLDIGFYEYQHGNLREAVKRYKIVISVPSTVQLKIQAFNNLSLVYTALGRHADAERCSKLAESLHRRQ
jgi:hypothetical protein